MFADAINMNDVEQNKKITKQLQQELQAVQAQMNNQKINFENQITYLQNQVANQETRSQNHIAIQQTNFENQETRAAAVSTQLKELQDKFNVSKRDEKVATAEHEYQTNKRILDSTLVKKKKLFSFFKQK
jgi:hypothetical protein